MTTRQEHEADGCAILWRRIWGNAGIVAFIEKNDPDTYGLLERWVNREIEIREAEHAIRLMEQWRPHYETIRKLVKEGTPEAEAQLRRRFPQGVIRLVRAELDAAVEEGR